MSVGAWPAAFWPADYPPVARTLSAPVTPPQPTITRLGFTSLVRAGALPRMGGIMETAPLIHRSVPRMGGIK